VGVDDEDEEESSSTSMESLGVSAKVETCFGLARRATEAETLTSRAIL